MIRNESTLNLLVDTVSSFVKEKLLPIELEISENDHIPEEIVEQMKELGMFGLSIPEEYGGIGLTFEEEVHVIMALSYASPVFRSIIGTNVGLGSIGIVLDGTEEQKKKYLPKIASGEYRASYALTEPDSGSDAASLSTTAKSEGDYYIINGTKRFITNAPEAGLFTVFARTNPERKKHQGISAFLVERGTPGLILGKPEKKMGQWGAHVCDVIFDNCKVPVENRLGEEGQGFITAMKILEKSRVHIAATCVGYAKRIIDEMVNYAINRKQFGQPIANFQMIQSMIAESKTECYAAECMVLETARKYDLNKKIVVDSSCTKLFASEMVSRVADNCVQVFGGYGYIREYPAERFYRDSRLFRIYEGTSEIQKIVIARNLIKAAQELD